MFVNDKDFTNVKIREALEYFLHSITAHMIVRREISLNETTEDTNDNVIKIQLARSSLHENFGFMVKCFVENDIFKRLLVTGF